MKKFLLLLSSAAFLLQPTSAFLNFHFRSKSQQELNLSSNADAKRSELFKYIIETDVLLMKNFTDSYKKIFEDVLQDDKVDELKTQSLKEHLAEFSDLVSRINALPEIRSRKSVKKLLVLFMECQDLDGKYADMESPTKEEKLIARLLEEHGAPELSSRYGAELEKSSSDDTVQMKEYIDSLSADDRVKDAKLIDWFETFDPDIGEDKLDVVDLAILEILTGEDEEEKD